MADVIPLVKFEKPSLPTLWLDTSVVIKLAKIKKGEALQTVEIERGRRLRDLIVHLVGKARLLCPESDQEEEYAAERLDKDVHGMFAELSLGISLTHRQGILDEQIFKGMEAYVRKSDTIHLPASSYFYDDPIRKLSEALQRRFIITVGPFKSPEILERRAKAKVKLVRDGRSFVRSLSQKGENTSSSSNWKYTVIGTVWLNS